MTLSPSFVSHNQAVWARAAGTDWVKSAVDVTSCTIHIQTNYLYSFWRHYSSQYEYTIRSTIRHRSEYEANIRYIPNWKHCCLLQCVCVWLYAVRACLGLLVVLGLTRFASAVGSKLGRGIEQWTCLLCLTQFHLLFYVSRPLPNIFALSLGESTVSLSWTLWPVILNGTGICMFCVCTFLHNEILTCFVFETLEQCLFYGLGTALVPHWRLVCHHWLKDSSSAV